MRLHFVRPPIQHSRRSCILFHHSLAFRSTVTGYTLLYPRSRSYEPCLVGSSSTTWMLSQAMRDNTILVAVASNRIALGFPYLERLRLVDGAIVGWGLSLGKPVLPI